MSTLITIRVPINKPTLELLDRLRVDYKDSKEVSLLLTRLRVSIVDLYIREYYIRK